MHARHKSRRNLALMQKQLQLETSLHCKSLKTKHIDGAARCVRVQLITVSDQTEACRVGRTNLVAALTYARVGEGVDKKHRPEQGPAKFAIEVFEAAPQQPWTTSATSFTSRDLPLFVHVAPPSTATKYCSDAVSHGLCHAGWRLLHLAASLKAKCFK